MRRSVLVYSFIVSISLHLLLFVPWTAPQKLEKKQETIPVAFKTIAKKETQPPAPKKAKDKPQRAKGLPQPSPPAVKPPTPPPTPEPPPKPRTVEKPTAVARKAQPPPPPRPEPTPAPKVEPVKPTPEPPAPPVAKKLAPAKDAKSPPKEKVKKKQPPKPKAVAKKKPVKKKKVAKKTNKAPRKKKTVAKKTEPRKKQTAAKKPLPTLKDLLPPVAGSARASGTHGNEYISMDSRDPKYSSWLASLQRDIYRTWLPSYPRGNIRGEVLIGIMIQKDGDLAHVEVLRSSGLGLLDRHALEAVRAAAPFKRFPPWMTQDEQGIKATFTYGGTPGSVRNWDR